MRLWHKDLIPVLPRQQLLGQWRECCLIAKNIVAKGTPNHLLVNKIMDYSMWDFWTYCMLVYDEMIKRGYKADLKKLEKWVSARDTVRIHRGLIFKEWHDIRYLKQCYYNLQEKYDCGGISEEEWKKIVINIHYKL